MAGKPGAPGSCCVISALFLPFQPYARRKLLQFMENVLSFSLYGYSKEKCILPSRS
jgi:hypothetical protein